MQNTRAVTLDCLFLDLWPFETVTNAIQMCQAFTMVICTIDGWGEVFLKLVGDSCYAIQHILVPFEIQYEPVHEISNNVVCATSKASDQPAHTRSLIRALTSRLSIL